MNYNMSNKQNEDYLERLKDYEEDMNDDYKSWQDAEEEIKTAIKWRDKMALNYAQSTVKYYNYKNLE